MKPDLSVRLADFVLKNPVMNCAGTMEPNEACIDLIKPQELGANVTKSLSLRAKEGNPQPRILEVPAGGLINRIGLQNLGVMNFVQEKIFQYVEFGAAALIVNIVGESIREFCQVAGVLEKKAKDYIIALEVNVSCPNVSNGLVFGSNAKLLFKLVKAVKSEVSLPLIIKLTPNVIDIGLIARAVKDGGADALSLINTVKSRAYIHSGPDVGRWIEGGLSGPCIKPIALQKVYEVSQAVNLPLIGMGGISNTQDALDFLRIEKVKAIAVGTATFRDPSTMEKIIAGLGKYLEEKGYKNIEEFKKKEVRK